VNRTDRLYALVEELRAVAPRPRSASWLAKRFEVSARTIERDLDALRQAGVPIWTETGRTGGYTLDRDRTLAPLALTADEAVAIAIALRSVAESPFAETARSASLKVLAGLPEDVRRTEQLLAADVYRVGREPEQPNHPELLAAVTERRVVHVKYTDPSGQHTERDVEPLGLLWGSPNWYLLAWCRLRQAIRGFQLGRITELSVLDELAADRRRELAQELRRLDAAPATEDR
jgi:predicted DNA-binding transcriptional regulator YafY